MAEVFSSENAEESGEPEYESLEEYIFETDRDPEAEISKAMRFRSWQEMQLRIIKNKIGTNAVEVVARSYLMGLSRLREDHHDEVESASEMLVNFLMVVGSDSRNNETVTHISNELGNYNIEEPHSDEHDLGDPRNYKVRESAVSEVENTYVQDAFFGPWIHRYVTALGFLDSEFVTEVTDDKLSSFSGAVAESMDEARDEIESMIMDYISMSQAHWVHDGIDEETYHSLRDIVKLMETDRAETCEVLLDRSEDLLQQNTEE